MLNSNLVNHAPEQATRAQDPIERNTIEQQLRSSGLQVTAQRLAVMEAVTANSHATTEELTEVVRGKIGSISRQSVYDTLGVFADKGLIRRIQPTGSVARYEDRVGDNHHHLVCRGCGLIFDIDCAVGSTPCLTADDDRGFEIDEAEVVYWGRCPDCRAELDAPSRDILQPNKPTK
jgi:Fe2+ or Zn2+ uptake regulation protein